MKNAKTKMKKAPHENYLVILLLRYLLNFYQTFVSLVAWSSWHNRSDVGLRTWRAWVQVLIPDLMT